jgi:hypothetical protein
MFIFMIFFCAGCVTVRLGGGGEGQRADGVRVAEPHKPFVRDDREDVDGAWKNAGNGNVISYLTDCKDPSDPPLDHIVDGVLAGLTNLHYDSASSPMFQEREARRVTASGKVDGVPSRIDLLVFKRNQCIYILSYVGVKDAFPANQPDFNAFVAGFRAP